MHGIPKLVGTVVNEEKQIGEPVFFCELHLMLHPIAVGHGRRLFEDTPTYPLELVSHETFKTGVLNLSYAPASG